MEKSSLRDGWVCPSKFQLENHWMNFDEILCVVRYAIGNYSKFVLINLLQSVAIVKDRKHINSSTNMNNHKDTTVVTKVTIVMTVNKVTIVITF
jgi:hypothetical protein